MTGYDEERGRGIVQQKEIIMTEAEHHERLKSAFLNLQAALNDAARENIEVEFRPIELNEIGQRVPGVAFDWSLKRHIGSASSGPDRS